MKECFDCGCETDELLNYNGLICHDCVKYTLRHCTDDKHDSIMYQIEDQGVFKSESECGCSGGCEWCLCVEPRIGRN